jgi:hypothetical protein
MCGEGFKRLERLLRVCVSLRLMRWKKWMGVDGIQARETRADESAWIADTQRSERHVYRLPQSTLMFGTMIVIIRTELEYVSRPSLVNNVDHLEQTQDNLVPSPSTKRMQE